MVAPTAIVTNANAARTAAKGNQLSVMARIPIILGADVLDDRFVRRRKRRGERSDPGAGKGQGILHRDLDFNVPVIGAANPFDGVKLLRVWNPRQRKPAPVVVARGIDHQSVSVPMPDGM